MISRRDLIKVAPIAIGGALVLPSPALAHNSGDEAPLIPNPTDFETTDFNSFINGASLTCESWTTGSGLREARFLTASGSTVGKGIEEDNHIDVWWQGQHYDFHDENLENRRLSIEDEYPSMSGGFNGVPSTSIQWGSITRAVGVQYVRYIDYFENRTYLIADMYTANLGWRRRVLDNNEYDLDEPADLTALVANIQQTTIDIRRTVAGAGVQIGATVTALAVTAGSAGVIAGPTMLAVAVAVGARLFQLYHRRMGYREELLGLFSPIDTYDPYMYGDVAITLLP